MLHEGNNVFVFTNHHYYIGKLITGDEEYVYLQDAAIVLDMGRPSHAFSSGDLREVEPLPPGTSVVRTSTILAITLWPFDLIRAPVPSKYPWEK